MSKFQRDDRVVVDGKHPATVTWVDPNHPEMVYVWVDGDMKSRRVPVDQLTKIT